MRPFKYEIEDMENIIYSIIDTCIRRLLYYACKKNRLMQTTEQKLMSCRLQTGSHADDDTLPFPKYLALS